VYYPGHFYETGEAKPRLWQRISQLEVADDYPYHLPDMQVLLGSYDPQSSGTVKPLLLYMPVGKGELYWMAAPELLSNHWLASGDNADFALSAIDLLRRPAEGGQPRQLYFDEHSHGMSKAGHNAFSMVTQTTGGRLLLLTGLLFVLLFAGAAVRPAKSIIEQVPQRRVATEMVLAQADLYQRAGARYALAESLVDGLRRAFMQSRHTSIPPNDRALLEWLNASGQNEAALADFLRSKMLPPSGKHLLELAQSCDRLRTKLEQGQL
jgi:hypothetical protein